VTTQTVGEHGKEEQQRIVTTSAQLLPARVRR